MFYPLQVFCSNSSYSVTIVYATRDPKPVSVTEKSCRDVLFELSKIITVFKQSVWYIFGC